MYKNIKIQFEKYNYLWQYRVKFHFNALKISTFFYHY